MLRIGRRTLTIAALAAGLAMATAGAAYGLVVIYDNDFKSRGEFRAIGKMSGGKACKKFHEKRRRLGVRVKRGPKLCRFLTPVRGDRSGPDHEIEAKVKLNKATKRKIRKRVYIAVGVRAAKDSGYDLRIYPQRRRWELHRNPSTGDFPIRGKLDSIRKAKKNRLKLRVFNDDVRAWINGDKVVRSLTDRNTAQVSGRKTLLAVSNGKKTKKNVKASFDDVHVKLPNP